MGDFIPLREFVAQTSQAEAGKAIGVSQGAIWQMLKAEREIFIREVSPGVYEAEERKKIGGVSHA